jgi:phosphatidylglycerol lysyltransferase
VRVPSTIPLILRRLPTLLGVLLFAAAVGVLYAELREVSAPAVLRSIGALPLWAVGAAAVLVGLNYLVLAGFDLLGFRYIGRSVAAWKVSVASFTGYAVSNSVGFALLTGTSVRYRFYARWGLSPADVSRVVVFYFGTYWLGLLVLGGGALAFAPHRALVALAPEAAVRGVGVTLLAAAGAYLAAAVLRLPPLRIRAWTLPFPPVRLVLGQLALSAVDWALAAGAFYLLLPRSEVGFGAVLGAFMAAQILGLVSHVPGGVGVFEGTMVVLLRGGLAPEQILSALLLYRLTYYVAPLALALAILAADGVRTRRRALAGLASALGTPSPPPPLSAEPLVIALDGRTAAAAEP